MRCCVIRKPISYEISHTERVPPINRNIPYIFSGPAGPITNFVTQLSAPLVCISPTSRRAEATLIDLFSIVHVYLHSHVILGSRVKTKITAPSGRNANHLIIKFNYFRVALNQFPKSVNSTGHKTI